MNFYIQLLDYGLDKNEINKIRIIHKKYAYDIPILFASEGSAFYYRTHNCRPIRIVINKNLNKTEVISQLLHEIGHVMHMGNRPHRNKWHIIVLERSAWKNAIKIANEYNLPINIQNSQAGLLQYDKRTCLKLFDKVKVAV